MKPKTIRTRRVRVIVWIAAALTAPFIAFVLLFLFTLGSAYFAVPQHPIAIPEPRPVFQSGRPGRPAAAAVEAPAPAARAVFADAPLAASAEAYPLGVEAAMPVQLLAQDFPYYDAWQKANVQYLLEQFEADTRTTVEKSATAPSDEIYSHAMSMMVNYSYLTAMANGASSGATGPAVHNAQQDLRRAIRQAYAREGRWIELANTYDDQFFDEKAYYLRKAGAEGKLELVRLAKRRTTDLFRTIGPFRLPWGGSVAERHFDMEHQLLLDHGD